MSLRKLFVWVQWAVVAGLAVFVLYVVFRPEAQPDYDPTRWNSWQGFFAVAYLGVSDKEDGQHVTAERLAGHLQALRAAGYRSITPDDAAAFLEGRAPLPDQALLVLFEGGRKDSFLRATTELRNAGFIAAMCVPTETTSRWGAFYLKKDDLEKVAGLAHWRLCSMGHDTFQPLPVDAKGGTGHFLTQRRWQRDRLENDSEFQHRIENDYAAATQILAEAGKGPVAAYVYPFADWETNPVSQSPAAAVNRAAAGRHHRIAFNRSESPFNGFGADPLSLTRLRLSGAWDSARLLAELKSYAPRTATVTAADRDHWIANEGIRADANRVEIAPAATAWVRGSEAWRDVDVNATLRLGGSGAIGALYARHASHRSYLRVALTAHDIQVQERVGELTRNLGGQSLNIDAAAGHVLRLRVKGRRAWVWLDGRLIAGPLPVAGVTHAGRVGAGAQNAPIAMTGFAAAPIRGDFVFAERFSALTALQNEQASVVLVPWYVDGKVSDPTAEQQRETLVAAAAGIETIPIFSPRSGPGEAEAVTIAADLKRALGGPALKRLISRIAVTGGDDTLAAALHAGGYQVVRIVDPAQARVLVEVAAVRPGDLLLIDGPAAEIMAVADLLLRRLPDEHIVALADAEAVLPPWMRRALRVGAATPAGGKR
jgi:hypothetical protein